MTVTPPEPPWTLAGIIRRQAAERPDSVALRCEGVDLTYGALHERSSRVAQALAAGGVGPGDRVAVLDKNSLEQIELFLGAAKLGAIPMPVNWRLAPAEVAGIIADGSPAVWVLGEEFEALAASAPEGPQMVRAGEFAAWRDAHPAEDPGVVGHASDVGFLMYSSGTTGVPKGVMLSNANMASSFTAFRGLIGLDGDSVNLVALPLFHIGGAGWVFVGLHEGARNVMVREVDPAALVDLLERERVTHAGLVPAILAFMLGVPGVGERDFSALRVCLYGASPISEVVLVSAMEVLGCDFVQAYGATETTATVVVLPAADHDPTGPHRHRLRAAGRPIGAHEVRIVDPSSGKDATVGEVGEVWLRGPNVTPGYWHQPEATAAAIVEGGWLRTGDAGYLDGDGYLYLHDRVKDMIVSGGENIYSIEIERVLAACPGVADVAVIAAPDDRWGETPVAVVVRTPGADVDAAALLARCREHLAAYKVPTRVEWRDALPRNPTGKVLKKELRAPYWEGRTRNIG